MINEMSREQDFFLEIISDFWQDRKTEIPSDIDWNVIQKYAKSHQVEGIIYYQTKKSEFFSAFAMSQYLNVNVEKIWDEIETKLNEASIPHFMVKGLTVAKYYPVPSLRTMEDIDLVVQSEDRNRVHRILSEMQFLNHSKGEREWIYNKGGIEIEIHSHLLYRDLRNSDGIIHFDSEKWNYVVNNQLDWNYHFIFLLLHLRKHILGQGAGIRQLLDIAVIREHEKLDWEWIFCKMNELQILDFYNACLDVINSIKEKMFFKETDKLRYILENGVFGFDNTENRINTAINIVNTKGKFGLFLYFLKDFFCPYKNLIQVPEFYFLRGKKYLLPVAWIIRGVHRINQKERIRKRYYVSDKAIKERNLLLSDWGIINK